MQRYKGDKIWEDENSVVAKTQMEGGNIILTLFSKERKHWWYSYIKVEFCAMADRSYINVMPGMKGYISHKEEMSDALIELLNRNSIDPNNREYMINQLSK